MSGLLFDTKPPTLADLYLGELGQIGNWVVANVRASMAWPLKVAVVEFRQHRIFVVPKSTVTIVADGSTAAMYPFVAVNLPMGTAFKEGCRLLANFLSSLAWVQGGGIEVEHWSGGSRAHPMGENRSGGIVTDHLEIDYLPDSNDQRVRWALAFYREGMSLERHNVAYAALSYFKILNIIHQSSKAQVTWINAKAGVFGVNNRIKFEVTKRISELQHAGQLDIGQYLYGSCRCAVAHAGLNPTVDPENLEDTERLTKDLPLIRAMATCVIESELGVKSASTVWSEHLYELAGFKRVFGEALVQRLAERDVSVAVTDFPAIPSLTVRIHGKDGYESLGDLRVVVVSVAEGAVVIRTSSPCGLTELDLVLDFPAERIKFDWNGDLRVQDDGSERGVRWLISTYKFLRDYVGNGKLEIYNTASGELLGRKDAYLPRNLSPGNFAEWVDERVAECEVEAQRRAQAANIPTEC